MTVHDKMDVHFFLSLTWQVVIDEGCHKVDVRSINILSVESGSLRPLEITTSFLVKMKSNKDKNFVIPDENTFFTRYNNYQ